MYRNSSLTRRVVASVLAALVTAATALTAVILPASVAGAAGAPAKVVFTTNPSTVAAGAVMATAPVVQLRDASNVNVPQAGVTVTLTVNTGPGTFDPSATTSVDTNASGQAVFSNLVFDTAGAYTLTAASSGLTSVNTGSFTVSPGPVTQMALTNVPATVVSGTSLGITTSLQDAFGNTATNVSSGTIALSVASGPAGGALGGTTSRTPSGGVTTFSSTLNLVGSYTITATYNAVTATTGAIAVTAGAAKKLNFVQAPTATTAGAVMNPAPTVQVVDAAGNAVADAGATVTVSSTGTITAGSTKSVTTDPTGLATFSNLTWNTAGSYTLTATSTGLSSTPASGPFTIAPGTATQLVFSTQPTTTAAGSAVTPTVVKIEDSLGNVITSADDDVTLTPNGPGGFDPSSTTTVAAVNGMATFSNLILDQSGSYTLSASSPDGAVGTSRSFTVTALAATHLAFTVQPASGAAGTTQSPNLAVAAEDQYGNINASTTGTVTISLTPDGTLSATTHALSNGVATFGGSFSVESVGTFTMTAALSGVTSATSNPFTITPGTPYKLVYGTAPSDVTAGQIMTPAPTVLIEDHFGNVETGDDTDTVTLTTSVGFDPASTTTETVVDGTATFDNVAIDDVGNVGHTIKASSSTVTVLPVTSATFNLSPAAPYSLAIVQPQLGGQVNTGNSIGTFYLEQYDQYGNNTWGPGPEGTPLTFSSSSPGGTFSLTDNGPSTTTGNFVYPPNDSNPPNNRYTYFYYGDTEVGLPTITVSSPGLISATQQVEIIDVQSPGDQTSGAGSAITPIQMTGQNSSPDYPFTSWSATGLPDGISIDPTSGLITGTPTTAGTYSVEVYGYEGTYAYGYVGFTWTVDNGVSVTSPGDQSSTVGAAITPVTVTATDTDPSATLTYSDGGTLPPGLSIDASSGAVTGTPSLAGVYDVSITATDGSGASGTATFTWTVAGPVITHLSKSSGTTAGGTRIVITGTGLAGATQVKFGSTVVTSLHVNRQGTKLRVLAPAHAAGTVDVVVTTPEGPTLPGPADQYTYLGTSVTAVSPTSGTVAGGNTVKISGTNLVGATEVLFGSTPGTVVSSRLKSVTAIAPAGTGTVDVTVVDPAGTTAVNPADQYTYVAPAVTALAPSSGPAAGGTRVRITGTDLQGATEVLFGSTPATILSANNPGTIITVRAPAGSGTQDVTVVTPAGTTPVSPADQYTYG